MRAITTIGSRFVAAGWSQSGGGDTDAAVWTSADGLTWTRARDDQGIFGGQGEQSILDVAAGGPGVVGVGYDFSGSSPGAAVWTSADGISWTRAAQVDGSFGSEIASVVAGGPGLVAVGWGGLGSGDIDAAVWTTVDGVRWSRVPHDEAVFGGSGSQVMETVTRHGSRLIAGGGDKDNAAVWTSSDGTTWLRVPHDEAVFGGSGSQHINHIASGGPGVVAVGWDTSGGDYDAAIWSSTDGVAWVRLPHEEQLFGGAGSQTLSGVVASGDTLVAVGHSQHDASFWVSRPLSASEGVTLDLTIRPPLAPQRYPVTAVAESFPFVLQFNLAQNVNPPSLSAAFPLPIFDIPLYELEYIVSDQDGWPFFCGRVDLYGHHGPGSLEVSPGIDVPIDAERLKISAKLSYQRWVPSGSGQRVFVDDITVTSAEFGVDRAPGDARYHRYRDGYIRGHLLGSGRGLSNVWLKEYEQDKDRKELLYHSRTFKVPRDHTRVYVPWTDECAGDKCGTSVTENSTVVYGGDENPLLRGGLAMATFALEYLSEGKVSSLTHALKLLEYFEKSEWIDQNRNRTGFFIRSRWPGKTHDETDLEYRYASIDEIIGMTLGLLYLDRALEKAGDAANRTRLESLVDRLGNRMKENYYFIVPYRRTEVTVDTPIGRMTVPKWDPIGLPEERHKGYAGGYPFQWFLAGGFRAITGNQYRPPDPQLYEKETDHPFWKKISQLPYTGSGDDVQGGLGHVLKLGLRSNERAILLIKGIGFWMYWGDQKYDLPIPCLPDWAPPIDILEFDYFHVPMLLHAFQLGMADEANRDPSVVKAIKQQMAILIAGILKPGGVKTRIDLWNTLKGYDPELTIRILLSAPWLGAYLLVASPFCSWEVDEWIGSRVRDDNYYAAAVASMYELPDFLIGIDCRALPTSTMRRVCEEGVARAKQEYNELITRAIDSPRSQFEPGLPVGERDVGVPGALRHNPIPKFIGGSVTWESPPGDRTQGGGSDGDLGLGDSEIKAKYERGVDAMLQGAGLGYLLPTALLHYFKGRFSLVIPEGMGLPYLGACSTLPRLAAPSPPSTDARCSFNYPFVGIDAAEGIGRNDSFLTASRISWGLHAGLTVDRATHPGYLLGDFTLFYVKYTNQRLNETFRIAIEQDYDYYYLDDDWGYGVQVTAEAASPTIALVVDGLGAGPVGGDQRKMRKSVPSRPRHLIMVTSRATTAYSLYINAVPLAEDQSIQTRVNTAVQLLLRGRDREGGTLSFALVTGPQHGTLSGTPPTLTYTPDSGYTGPDSFTFKVTDGTADSNPATVSIAVSP